MKNDSYNVPTSPSRVWMLNYYYYYYLFRLSHSIFPHKAFWPKPTIQKKSQTAWSFMIPAIFFFFKGISISIWQYCYKLSSDTIIIPPFQVSRQPWKPLEVHQLYQLPSFFSFLQPEKKMIRKQSCTGKEFHFSSFFF